jgi:nitroimidazol reductase NimA-like FMN-containing flavoprotein (pyridoxamine 5'-phosphate oxidase superfamily)
MITPDTRPVTTLTDAESWAALSSVTLGRLATDVGGQPDIFPVNFVVQRHTILIRTAEGTKLLNARVNAHVAFEADDHAGDHGWSVVVKGRCHVIATSEEFDEAERAQVMPWVTTTKRRYVRIVPAEIAGRRFQFGGDQEDVSDPSRSITQ